MEFMPEHAPFVVLLFLGTGFALLLAAIGITAALVAGKRRLAKWLSAALLAGEAGYFALLLAVAATSRERVLKPGEKKYFCEIDCHLAYSVESTTMTRVLGVPSHLANAAGTFYVVTVKTWFDERTISTRRGYAPLTPNPRVAYIVDGSDRSYAPSPVGQKALEEAKQPSAPLTQVLRPGEAYTTALVFDLPVDVSRPRLFLGDLTGIEQFLIGHENSFFHKKIFFALEPLLGKASL